MSGREEKYTHERADRLVYHPDFAGCVRRVDHPADVLKKVPWFFARNFLKQSASRWELQRTL